jgi:hypothetical protein
MPQRGWHGRPFLLVFLLSLDVLVSEFLLSLVYPQNLDVYYSYFLVLLQDPSVILWWDDQLVHSIVKDRSKITSVSYTTV